MDKSLKRVKHVFVITLLVSYLMGCTTTEPAPIRAATLSPGAERGKRQPIHNDSTVDNSAMATDNSAMATPLSQNPIGWVPMPPPITNEPNVKEVEAISNQRKPNSVIKIETTTNNDKPNDVTPIEVIPNKDTNVARYTNQPTSTQPTSTNSQTKLFVSAIPNRNYSDIAKGSFIGNYYTVQRGDTLFYIAWISNNDYRELAQKNKISEPYHLTVGQILNVGNTANIPPNKTALSTTNVPLNRPVKPVAKSAATTNKTISSTPKIAGNTRKAAEQPEKLVDPLGNKKPTSIATQPKKAMATTPPPLTTTPIVTNMSKINWHWPTTGKIIDGFSASEGGNKGIDIAGNKGQTISSAADGRVVYAGNALRGYGNLIIIKHNDDYLSAYAHNDTMLVSEQQEVKAGQKIATMGSSGASSVRLHFEVRYKGKSVNPLQYLPQR